MAPFDVLVLAQNYIKHKHRPGTALGSLVHVSQARLRTTTNKEETSLKRMAEITFNDVRQRRYKDQAVFFMNAVSLTVSVELNAHFCIFGPAVLCGVWQGV